MSETFNVNSSAGPYEVHIGHGRPDFGESSQVFYLADQRFYEAWSDWVPGKALKIEALENNKTLASCEQIIEAMRDAGMTRESQLIAFGGGIIQDLATLCASLYMRGIKWTYYPTTLLGMVDSCVGGKASINVGQYKNIAGNYFPPEKIVINVEFSKTLPLIEQIAGLCEAVKICFAAKNNAFDRFITHFIDCSFPFSDKQLEQIIALSLRTKKTFIEEDEFDQGSRLLLNFGHTIGHAIEAASHFSITHGVAIGLGMLAEIHIGMLLHSQTSFSERVQQLNDYICNLLKFIPEITNHIRLIDTQKALNAFQSDKKHSPEKYWLISIDQDGYLVRISIPKNGHSDEMIIRTFEWLKGAVAQ
jgi:3-dehydroquinate synthase